METGKICIVICIYYGYWLGVFVGLLTVGIGDSLTLLPALGTISSYCVALSSLEKVHKELKGTATLFVEQQYELTLILKPLKKRITGICCCVLKKTILN
jgi:hypothetical protein